MTSLRIMISLSSDFLESRLVFLPISEGQGHGIFEHQLRSVYLWNVFEGVRVMAIQENQSRL